MGRRRRADLPEAEALFRTDPALEELVEELTEKVDPGPEAGAVG